MAFVNRPLLLLTDGTTESLVALPGVAALAAALGVRVDLLYLGDDATPTNQRAIASAIAALPSELHRPDVLPIPAQDRTAALNRLAQSTGGILALLPDRGRSVSRLLYRNTYEHLLRRWSPLLALPATQRIGGVTRVLFPADLSPRSDAAFDETIALCQLTGAELRVLHVFGDDRLLPTEQDLARRAATRSPRELLRLDQERIGGLVERARRQGIRAASQTAEGRAHTHILGYASANAIDLIVMPSHGPRTIEDILRGSTTVRVIQDAAVPILVQRSQLAHADAPSASEHARAVGAAVEQS
jgi:nucleotide-binding universal stress UspA family protein